MPFREVHNITLSFYRRRCVFTGPITNSDFMSIMKFLANFRLFRSTLLDQLIKQAIWFVRNNSVAFAVSEYLIRHQLRLRRPLINLG